MTASDEIGLPAPFFLTPLNGGSHRFALRHAPASGEVRAAVLFVHALADEMNKSRRMVALASRRLASEGCVVLQIDLHGCGDSSGNFGDSTWHDWLLDVERAAQWLTRHVAGAPLVLWGHRAGCLLIAELARQMRAVPAALLFWQPPPSGKALLQQLMRLRAVAGIQLGKEAEPNQAEGSAQVMSAMRSDWRAGRSVHIAGYEFSAALAEGLERATLDPPPSAIRLAWIETTTRAPIALLPASAAACARWEHAGHEVQAIAVEGPAFWQTVEIEDAPALIDATAKAIDRIAAPTTAAAAASLPALEAPSAEIAAGVVEQPLHISCGGESLLGLVSRPKRIRGAAVMVIVGGPQYRVGSHRQFVQLTRALASAGHPALRFDVRGMGDATGNPVDFQGTREDISAACAAFAASLPAGTPIVLWGLCDGASAALLHLEGLGAAVAGLVLTNPWVRSGHSLAATHLKHYYGRRLLEAAFWNKLVRGHVGLGAVREFVEKINMSSGSKARGTNPRATAGFQQRMAASYSRFEGPVLLLISDRDITAREFEEFAATDPAWQTAMRRRTIDRVVLNEADHTFSQPNAQQAAEEATIEWLSRSMPQPP